MSSTSRWLACGLILGAGLVGCSRGLPPDDGSVAVNGTLVNDFDLSAPAESVDLAALLKTPREELAQRCDELAKTIRSQEQFHLEGKLPYTLLPDAKLPLVLPVFRDAAYSKERELTLPPYVKGDARDSAIALHVARFGDLDAAIKLVDPDDDATAKLLREAAFDKAYPVEWTRLVALLMHKNQVALAADDKDAAKNLMWLHKQVRAVLDDKAKQSPLGVALLSRGFLTLKQAAAAWRAGSRADLEAQVNAFFASVGTPPAYKVAVPANVDELARMFGSKAGANGMLAATPGRAADLLNLYVPTDDSDTCVAYWNDAKKVNDVLFTYRPLYRYETAQQFAEPLEDLLTGKKDDNVSGCPRRTWNLNPGQLDVTLTPRHATLGAVVRIQLPGGADDPVTLSRDFGPVHLDRTFEGNRRLVAWSKRGDNLMLVDKAAAQLTNPLNTRPLLDVVIQRDGKNDLLKSLDFEYGDNQKDLLPAAGNIARPLLLANGRPMLVFGEIGSGAVDFVWTDPKTRYSLRFPFSREAKVTLAVADVNASADFENRVKLATAKDAADRVERIKNRKPLSVVPRHVDGFKLGMTRADFKALLPKSPHVVEREIPGGIMAAFLGAPPKGTIAMPREWFARFENDKAVELRVRYVDVPTNKPGTFLKKLDGYKSALGAPEVSANAADLWSDLPKRGASQTLSWQDDVTQLTCRQEPFSLELTLRDCPADRPNGVQLPPIEYLARGAGDVMLGMSKDALVKLGAQPSEGNAFLVDAAKKDGFDAVLAWVEDGKVSRIVARHKVATPMKGEPQASKALLDQWAKDSKSLGWPSRQDVNAGNIQSLASRDDQTRFRLFWQEEPHGVSVFSEWKDVK